MTKVLHHAMRACFKFPKPKCIKCRKDEKVTVSGTSFNNKDGPHVNWHCKTCEIIWNIEEVFTNNLEDPHFIPMEKFLEQKDK